VKLARPLPSPNLAIHQHLLEEARKLQPGLDTSMVDEVRRVVWSTVSSPPCSATRVAKLLGIQRRPLQRRLLAEGTSFRQLRDEVLYGMSRQMLRSTSMKIAEVAVALGYSEAAAFIHAFTRWSSETPDKWRRAPGHSN
jgi:AraC-like DNA-binding protein